jgi:hypothetical protein
MGGRQARPGRPPDHLRAMPRSRAGFGRGVAAYGSPSSISISTRTTSRICVAAVLLFVASCCWKATAGVITSAEALARNATRTAKTRISQKLWKGLAISLPCDRLSSRAKGGGRGGREGEREEGDDPEVKGTFGVSVGLFARPERAHVLSRWRPRKGPPRLALLRSVLCRRFTRCAWTQLDTCGRASQAILAASVLQRA